MDTHKAGRRVDKLYIIMVGLPARGKSTLAYRLYENLVDEGINAQVFNSGNLRRTHYGPESSLPEFYHPENERGKLCREKLTQMNMELAREFLQCLGQVAIIDAANVSSDRRKFLQKELVEAPVLFVECINQDQDILDVSIAQKALLSEFSKLSHHEAIKSFWQRISYYESTYTSLQEEKSFIQVDTLRNMITKEKNTSFLPFYSAIRDIIVSDCVRNLYLARHGESTFNLERRIGGDPHLTDQGQAQAHALADFFTDKEIPYVFTSSCIRSIQTAAPLRQAHPETVVVPLPELGEIDAGICDGMTYEEIKAEMPEEFARRGQDKYMYVYPGGEGYATMKERVERGLRKALFLTGGQKSLLIVGHQAVNRMILSLFLFRRTEEVPYIYVPQTQLFHLEMTHRRKLFELVHFMHP